MDDQKTIRKSLKEPLLGENNDQERNQQTSINPDTKATAQTQKLDQDLTMTSAMKKIFSLAIYPIIGMVFHPAYHICNSIILGHDEDPRLLASLGLGGLTISIFLLSVGISFCGSLDTLISQAFGQKDFRLCGIYLNRQLYLTTLVYIPLAIPLWFCEYGFLYFGQDPFISSQAAIYVRVCIPGILFFTYGSCLGRFCSGHRETRFGMVSNIFSSIIHFFLAYLLAITLDLGMFGIAIASCIHFFLRFLVYVVLIAKSERLRASLVSIWDPNCKNDLWPQFVLSLQCASLGIWSWWAFDIFTLIASYMSVDDLAAQTVLRNIGLLTYMIPVGLSISSVILVGNMIGANNPNGAKLYAKMCTLSAFIWALASVAFINLLQGQVIGIFSSSVSVNELILRAFNIISIFVFFDCVQGVGQGVIRGLGKQGEASYVTIFGYWVLGIPISIDAVFYHSGGIVGLWIGPSVAIIFNFIFYYVLILRTDWQKVCDEVQERRARDNKKLQ
ncbi:na+-driven multidrug efflux pump [Stylonychia lemnae]|uniref:Na+-driven multidrug efflux pump n=1 Tax=Stylonychia lemnae TaxID=5949 RepID=A0A078ATR0_STYLE|nr:na+-driven multidrug efflux pump [Stylonychia lemnae]|eukprot:CDW84612.1 na+-driven multidrug efflux pump [Stylonychia lemnae]